MTTDDTATATAVASLPLAPGHWRLDPAHASVTFAIRHLGLSKVRGRFGKVDATLDVGAGIPDVKVAATVALDSLDTGNTDRDAHVRSPDLLDVANRPTMAFESTAITGNGEAWEMEGVLTIGAVSRPVTFEVEFNGVSDALGPTMAGFGTTGRISRKDYGLDFGVANALLGDAVTFELDLEFLAPGTEGGDG